MLDISRSRCASSCTSNLLPLSLRQTGFSLIELLVSLLIFSVGILGLASLQITSMRMAQDAQLHYIANLLANAISDQISVNQLRPDTLFWEDQVTETLPSGRTLIEERPGGYRITLRWTASEAQVDGGVAEYVLEVAR